MSRLLILLPFAVLSCAAIYGEPQRDTDTSLLDATVAASDAVLVDAGLGDGLANTEGIRFLIPNGSDGHSWAPDEVETDAGYSAIFGDSSNACPRKPMPHIVYLASFDWPRTAICHELAHVARGCWPDDHEYFRRVGLDSKCGEAMRGVLALNLSGASGN